MPLELVLGIFAFVVFVLSVSWHNFAQVWLASKLGDPTARMLGRQTMSPLRHIDVLGTIIWPLIYVFRGSFVLGWAKPILVTPNNFKRPAHDEALVWAVGPVAHLLAAALCLVVLLIIKHVVPDATLSLISAEYLARHVPLPTDGLPNLFPVVLFLYFGILINLLQFVFNLIPLPMLDGGRILRIYLPYNVTRTLDSMSLYIMIGFMFLGFPIVMYLFSPLLEIFNRLLEGL